MPGHQSPHRTRCEYLGDQDEAGSRFWLGEENILLRYRCQQAEDKLWDVWLVES